MKKALLVLLSIAVLAFAATAFAADQSTTVAATSTDPGIVFSGKGAVITPTTKCITMGEVQLAAVQGNMEKPIMLADVMCNGFWCGTGDNAVCCHSTYRHCCKVRYSESYYCSNDDCTR